MFHWADFYSLALELSTRQDAASQRCAISRAYYAAFHAACTYLQDVHQLSLPRHEKHAFVWKWFDPRERTPGRTVLERKIGKNGARLHQLRCDADYELKFEPAKHLAYGLSQAQRLLDDLERLQPPR